jgi:6-phosphogluconolactonase (cycloisomerase 2 family)
VTGSNAPVTPAYSGPELTFSADVSAAPGGLSANASFGALEVHVTDGDHDYHTNQFQTSFLHVQGSVNLVDPQYNAAAFNPNIQATYDRLRGSDLQAASDPKQFFNVLITANGGLHMHVTSDPNLTGVLPPSLGFIGQALQPPKFDFDFNLTGSARVDQEPGSGNFQFHKSLDNMSIDHIQMDVGGLMGAIAKPLANVLGGALGPITDIIGSGAGTVDGFLNAPLPLISQLLGHNVSLVDLSGGALAGIDTLAKAIGGIATFAHDVSTFLQNYNGQPIPLGSWVWVPLISKCVPRQAVDALTFNLPPVQLPSLQLPDLQLPDIRLPDINVPGFGLVHIPAIHVPVIHLGSIPLPNINISLPVLTLPDIQLPDIPLPSIPLPDLRLGPITLPSGITLTLPDIPLPNLTLPAIHLGNITLPNLQLPDLTHLSLPLPSVTLPTIPLPNLTLPDFTLTITPPSLPSFNLPIRLPSLALPNLPLPTLPLPPLSLPGVPMPDLTLGDANLSSTGTDTSFVQNDGFKIDILQAQNIVKMFLNQPFDIVEYDLPGLILNQSKSFDLGFHLGSVGIDGSISAGFNELIFPTAVVYDSTGLSEIVAADRAGGTVDWSKLLDGFYMPVPQNGGHFLDLGLNFNGYASADAFIASAWLSGSLSGDIHLDIKDADNDGKLRLNEIMALTDNFNDPAKLISMFDAGVSFSASLDGGGKLGIDPLSVSFSLSKLGLAPHVNINISLSSLFPQYSVPASPPPPPPVQLATEEQVDGQEVLRLNIGPYASSRGGASQDDTNGANITVSGSNGNLVVTGYGTTQTFTGNYAYILASGGPGPDMIDCSGVSGVDVHAFGGGGNATIKTGNDNAYVETGDGNVTVYLGAGYNTVIGGRGQGTVHAAAGSNNHVDFSTSGRSSYYGGGGGNDSVFGSAYGDHLEAGHGPGSVHFVGGGGDVLYGGVGNDLLDGHDNPSGGGGTGVDAYYGGLGNNTIVAAFGDKWIDGGAGGTNTLNVSGKFAQVTNGVITNSSLQSSAGTTPFVNISSVQVQLGNYANSLTVNGVSMPFSLTGGNKGDTIDIQSLYAPGPVAINLGTGDDTLTIQNTQSVLNITDAGYYLAGNTLVIDESASPQSVIGTLNGHTITITGMGAINYSGFQYVNIDLGSGSDSFTVQDTAPDALRTTIQGGGGYDNFYVYNASTQLRVYYVAYGNSLSAYAPNGSGGLTPLQELDSNVPGLQNMAGALAVAVSPDGRLVYMATYNGILTFSRNTTTGIVYYQSFLNLAGTGWSPLATMTVTNYHLFVASGSGSNQSAPVLSFARDAVTGALGASVSGLGGSQAQISPTDPNSRAYPILDALLNGAIEGSYPYSWYVYQGNTYAGGYATILQNPGRTGFNNGTGYYNEGIPAWAYDGTSGQLFVPASYFSGGIEEISSYNFNGIPNRYGGDAIPPPPNPGADNVATAAYGNEIYGVSSKFSVLFSSQVNGSSTALQNGLYVNGITANSSVAVSPDGKWLYVSMPGANGVPNQFQVYALGANGSFSFKFGILPSGIPGRATAVNGYVYVPLEDTSAIAVYRQNVDGSLTSVATTTQGVSNPSGVTALTTSSGTFLYVGNTGNGSVSVYQQNLDGTLTFVQTVQNNVGGVSGLGNPGEMAAGTIAGGNTMLYVTGQTQNAIVGFNVNPGTGALTYVGTVRQGVGGINGLAGIHGITLTSDGKYVVATGSSTNTAVVFGVLSNGRLLYLQRLKDGSGTTQDLSDPLDVTSDGSEIIFSTGGPGHDHGKPDVPGAGPTGCGHHPERQPGSVWQPCRRQPRADRRRPGGLCR